MIGIVLLAVLFDRTAVTFRTLAIAATLALVAGYRHGLPFARPNADTSFSARIALWGVREILSLIFASLLAGLATTPYAAFHFKRIALRETPNMPMDTVLPWEQFPVPA